MAPSQASNYQSLTLTGGTLALANSLALPAGVNIEIDGGATLNPGGLSDLPAVNDVTMNNGIITDGTLARGQRLDPGRLRRDRREFERRRGAG